MPQADRSHTIGAVASRSDAGGSSKAYADYAARLADTNAAAVALMSRIREAADYLRRCHGYSLASFRSCTGLHKNSLLRVPDRKWVPKPATLQRLDRLIVRAAAKQRGEIFRGETIKRGRPRGRKRSS